MSDTPKIQVFEFENRLNEILLRIPRTFQKPFSKLAYEMANDETYETVLAKIAHLVDALRLSIKEYGEEQWYRGYGRKQLITGVPD